MQHATHLGVVIITSTLYTLHVPLALGNITLLEMFLFTGCSQSLASTTCSSWTKHVINR